MRFERIKYLDWAKQHMGTAKYDLARADVQSLRPEEIGWTGEGMTFNRQWENAPCELIPLIAKRYGVAETSVFLTHGASMGIFLTCVALLERGDEVLIEVPNYEPLARVAQALEVEVRTFPREFDKHFEVDLESLQRKISRNTKAIIVTNFHNPTGKGIPPEQMSTLGQIARQNSAYVICGEAYSDFAFGEPIKPAFTLADNMFSINSMTKICGLGGIRCGWVLCGERFRARMSRIQDYVTVTPSYPSEQIALAAMRKVDDLVERARRILTRNLAVVREWVESRKDIRWVPPDGGTICFLKLPAKVNSWDLMALLRTEYDTLIVPGDFFGAHGFVRVGFGGDAEKLQGGLERMGQALDRLQ